MTAGNIVLSDQGLVSFFETPNAIGVCIPIPPCILCNSQLCSSFLRRPMLSRTRLRLHLRPTFCKSRDLHLTYSLLMFCTATKKQWIPLPSHGNPSQPALTSSQKMSLGQPTILQHHTFPTSKRSFFSFSVRSIFMTL
jgi:hypothetical protein